MSSRIAVSERTTNQPSVKGPDRAPARPGAFDPQKAAQQPVEKREDAFSQALREATDGDSSEAEARGSLGLSGKDGTANESSGRVERKSGRADGGQGAADRDAEQVASKDPLERLRAQAEVAGVEGGEEVDDVKVDFARISESHDNLMTLVDTLSRQQVATHIAQGAAAAVLEILSSPLWSQSEGIHLELEEPDVIGGTASAI